MRSGRGEGAVSTRLKTPVHALCTQTCHVQSGAHHMHFVADGVLTCHDHCDDYCLVHE
jgi:hypothetical protein